MTSLSDPRIGPGRMHLLPGSKEWSAYIDLCESAIVDGIVRHVASMSHNNDRAAYFQYSMDSAALIEDDDARARRVAFIKKLKRKVYRAMLDRAKAA